MVQALFWRLARWLLWLRYRVRINGLEEFRRLQGPLLVMPNHPAYIDPPLLLSHLGRHQPIRPVVIAGMYRNPALYPFMRLVNALEVPELVEHSRDAHQRTLTMIDTVVARIERGESFLIYPSGRVQQGNLEEIGAARAAAEILQRCPQVQVVLVRTRGLWGSMFGYAATGRRPNLGRCALRALGWILANLIFFAPRRNVSITIEPIDRSRLPGLDRETLNRYLEEWYNREAPQQPRYVPYHAFIGPREFHFPERTAAGQFDYSKIRPATINAVQELVEEHLGHPLPEEERQPQTRLEQIGLDSLERMDLALQIEDRFGFHSDRVPETLRELWALAEGLQTGDAAGPITPPPLWNRPPRTLRPADIVGNTLPEAFLRRVLAHPDDVVVADQVSGTLTYRKLLVAAQLMGRRLAKLEGSAVGVLLPASVAADLVFFALHLEGKLPVMLNWTTGPANLAHAVEILGIRRVVTSRKLIDRLGIEVAGAEFVFLEDLRETVGKLEAAATMAASYWFPRRRLARLPAAKPDDPAVVLFTSGSESTPKAVPLSHRNLLWDAQAGLALVEPTRADVMLGFLPPFHSFGVLGTLIAPIVSGMRVVHHPDPTDANGLVRLVAGYRATLLVTTPTFLSYMFAVAKPDDLRSLRMIISGAEKCPETLFARARQMAPQATILEGYGITECSPVVSGNRPGHIKPGTVGQPIDGVEVCVVDPESKQPLPPSTTGLLLVRGPTIFPGYLHYDGPDPFIDVAGKRWYVTGDLVQVDQEQYIHFRGRLKRFLKAGGEMISLPALEEPFGELYPPTEHGPQVAVEGIETHDGRRIVLFCTLELSLRQANAVLTEAGFRGVMRLDEVRRVNAIPVLGTGKTDYKVLRKMIGES